jgi:iron(III) transport system permease protein
MSGGRGVIWSARVLAMLVVLPVLASLWWAFSPSGIGEWAYWWHDGRGWRIFVGSVGLATFGAAVAIVFGAALAFSLPRNRSIARLLLAAACLPVLVPSSLMGVGWIMAMGTDAVVTNQLRKLLGSHTPTIYNWPMAAGATGLRYFGIAALILASVRFSTATARAAERVFTLSWRTRARIRFSALITPLIATAGLLLVLVFSDHILPGLFLIHTFGTEVLVQYNALMNPSGAAVLALLPTILSLLVALLVLRLLARRSWTLARDDAEAVRPRFAWPIAMLTIGLALGIPIAGLIVRASSAANLVASFNQSRAEAVHSLWLAAIGALVTVSIALPLAAAALWHYHDRRISLAWIVLTNLVVPGSLLALGMISLFSPRPIEWLQDTELPLIFGYAARFVPVVVLALFVAWLRLSPLASAAARLHCRSLIIRLFAIALPPRLPAIIASLALAALLIAAELDISLILVRPGPTTLGVRLYTLIHLAPDAVVSALAIDMLLLVMATVILFLILRAAAVRFVHGSAR